MRWLICGHAIHSSKSNDVHVIYLDDPYYCGFKAKTIFTKAVKTASKDNSSTNSSSSKSTVTINESKKSSVSSFFSSSKNKDGSKSKDKDKEKEKEKEKEKVEKEVVKELTPPKQRPSYAQMPHPASFSTLYQLHQMQNGLLNGTIKNQQRIFRHHSQPDPYMHHAKSYDNGIGKKNLTISLKLNFNIKKIPDRCRT